MSNAPKTNSGGPAFPFSAVDGSYYESGMTLRDWFAAKSHQPGTAEAYQLRGCPDVPKPVGYRDEDWYGDENMDARAHRWFKTLTLDEKYAIYAELRFKIADAMLKAREGGAA